MVSIYYGKVKKKSQNYSWFGGKGYMFYKYLFFWSYVFNLFYFINWNLSNIWHCMKKNKENDSIISKKQKSSFG